MKGNRDSGIREILFVESGIPLKIGIQNPSSIDRDGNPESKSFLDVKDCAIMMAVYECSSVL